MSALEEDSIRLRRALKNQAGAVGEQGFKFAGMSPDLLVKVSTYNSSIVPRKVFMVSCCTQVNEFASALRDGLIELPVDDRSAQLLKENKQLKDDARVLEMKISR